MDSDRDRLNDILEAIRLIQEVAQQGEVAFGQSKILQSAVLYNFLVIGEAVTQVSENVKQANPEVKWREIKSLRNLLIHGYMHTNLQIVWGIIETDIDELREQVQAMLVELDN